MRDITTTDQCASPINPTGDPASHSSQNEGALEAEASSRPVRWRGMLAPEAVRLKHLNDLLDVARQLADQGRHWLSDEGRAIAKRNFE